MGNLRAWASLTKRLPSAVLASARAHAAKLYRRAEAEHGSDAPRVLREALRSLSLPSAGEGVATAAPLAAAAELWLRVKERCKPGERADLTGCTPAEHEGGESRPAARPAKPDNPTPKKPTAKPAPAVPEKQPSEKAARALASAKRVDKTIQRYAEGMNEPRMAKVIGGWSLPDSEPNDLETKKILVELKTMVDNANQKITMDSYSQVRKIAKEQETGKQFHTVVSDDAAVFNALGDGKHDDSKRVYYYRRGVAGSARIPSLHRCKNEAELLRLMKTPEDKLPPAAQRTDAKLRVGKWVFFQDDKGKGYRNSKTGQEFRAKK